MREGNGHGHQMSTLNLIAILQQWWWWWWLRRGRLSFFCLRLGGKMGKARRKGGGSVGLGMGRWGGLVGKAGSWIAWESMWVVESGGAEWKWSAGVNFCTTVRHLVRDCVCWWIGSIGLWTDTAARSRSSWRPSVPQKTLHHPQAWNIHTFGQYLAPCLFWEHRFSPMCQAGQYLTWPRDPLFMPLFYRAAFKRGAQGQW